MYILCQYGANILNTLRPEQNGCRFADDIFKWTFYEENVWTLIRIQLISVYECQIDNVSIGPKRCQASTSTNGDTVLLTHICATGSPCVN